MADAFSHIPDSSPAHVASGGDAEPCPACLAYEHIGAPVYVLDRRLLCVYANPAACELFGRPAEALLGQTISAMFPSSDTSALSAEDVRALEPDQTGAFSSTDATFHVKGRMRRLRFVRHCANTPEYGKRLVVVLQDTSAEQNALEHIDALESALSTSRDMICILDQQFRLEMVNDALCIAYGLGRSRLLGRPFGQIMGQDAFHKHFEQHLHRSLSGECVSFQAPMVFTSGRTRRMEVLCQPLREQANGKRLIVLCCQDVTLHATPSDSPDTPLKGELGLLERLQHARVLLSADGLVRMANPAAEDMLGRAFPELEGRDFGREFCSSAASFAAMIDAAYSQRSIVEARLSLRRKDGSVLPCTASLRLVSGNLDMTLRAASEHEANADNPEYSATLERRVLLRTSELSRANKQLLDKVHELEATKRQLSDHRRRLRELAYEVSVVEQRQRRRMALELHDGIGQDLAMTRIQLSAMRSGLGQSELGRQCDELLELVKKMIGQTRSLIWEMGSPELYELGFEAAIEDLAEEFQSRHAIAVLCSKAGPAPLPLNEQQQIMLFQMVRELLTNVAKHAEAGESAIIMEQGRETITIAVEDDGKGMTAPPSPLQGDRQSGFGLFSIRERLDLIGGSFRIEKPARSDGRGARFILTVPRQDTSQEELRA